MKEHSPLTQELLLQKICDDQHEGDFAKMLEFLEIQLKKPHSYYPHRIRERIESDIVFILKYKTKRDE